MKDYYHYNFNAIRGAHVEMDVRDGRGFSIHPRGEIIYQEKNTILLESESGLVSRYYTYDIIPGSLSAKIKVDDMTIKQTRNLQNVCNGKSTFNGNEVLDCTEWGWHKN